MIPVTLDCTQWLSITDAVESIHGVSCALMRAECEPGGMVTISRPYEVWCELIRLIPLTCKAGYALQVAVSDTYHRGADAPRIQANSAFIRATREAAREADAEYSAEGYQRSPVRREAVERAERRDTRKAKTGTGNQRRTRKPKPEVHVKNLGLTQGGLFGDL